MATIYRLQGRGHTLTITLASAHVITGEGESRVVQSFASEEAAREHVERVARIRRREGYGLLSVQEIDDAAALADPDPLEGRCEWDPTIRRLGVVFRADEGMTELCEALIARIAAAEARLVHLVCDPASPGEAFTDALAERRLPTVESLIFDTYFQTVARQSTNSIGDLAEVLQALPRLTRLFATGDLALWRTRHPTLQALYLLGDPLNEAVLTGLADSSFPALTELGLKLAAETGPVDAGPCVAALRSLEAPSLATIAIDGLDDLPGVLRALTATPLPAAWRSLRLAGSIDDEDALLEALKVAAPRLVHLEALALPLGDDLSVDGEAAARALVPCLCDVEEEDDIFLPTAYDGW